MVARVLRDSPIEHGERDILAQAFANRFGADNPLFDSSRFDAAIFRGEIYRGSTARHGGWTRQDYEMIADVLRNAPISGAARVVTAQTFADRLYYDNPRFNANIFFKRAVGPDYETAVYRWNRDRWARELSVPARGVERFRRPAEVHVRQHRRRA